MHALLDGELDAGHAREVEAHLDTCARCAAQLAGLPRSAARHVIGAAALRRARALAPAHRGCASVAADERCTRQDRRGVLKGFVMGAALSTAMAASLVVAVIGTDGDQRVLGDVVSAHVRSLQAEHLTDVQTSDQHTVKPWFNGKLDISPPVVDLTAQGFPLIGGRLDYVDGKAVASIVYRRRSACDQSFRRAGSSARRSEGETAKPCRDSISRAGARRGLDFFAISDLNAEELREFVDKFETAQRS